MTHPVRAALVGFGYAGRTFHAPLIAACPDMRLEAVVSRQATAVVEAWPGARVLATFDQAIADLAIDLIVLATPNDLHAAQAEAALKAGKAVVVDKPFTLTAAEARRLAALAEERGLLLSVFHNRRWDADFLTLQALLAEDRLGPVVRFESCFNRWRPEVRDRWREGDGSGAGIWYDLGPHLIDQALCLFGRPLGVSCDLAVMRPGGKATDYAHAVLRYADKRVVLHADMVTPAADARFAVHGTRASWLKDGLDVQEDQLKSGLAPGAAGWGIDPRPGVVVDGATGAREAVAGPP
ncbi:MAG TPA: oxidoreductase, partial [Brevundimonas sp.]|nr:oxidoreductase [Brevundimonas sp.]